MRTRASSRSPSSIVHRSLPRLGAEIARSHSHWAVMPACEPVGFDGGLSRLSHLHVSMEARLSDTVLTRDKTAIWLHPADNVVVAVRRLPAGTVLPGDVTTREPVPFGHKVATAAIAPGDAVRKYGQVIGVATQPIIAPALMCTCTIWRCRSSAPTRRLPDFWRRNEEPRTFRGLPPQGRTRRRAQLYRRPHQRELFGDGRAAYRRGGREDRAARRLRQRRRHRADHPRQRLRHGRRGRGFRPAAAHAVGHGGQPEFRRHHAGRPRLRGDADPAAEGRLRHRRRCRASSPSPSRTSAARGGRSRKGSIACAHCCRR